MQLHSANRMVVLSCLVLAATPLLRAQDWTPLPPQTAGTPPAPVHPGHFEYRIDQSGPDGRDKIAIRWVPPPEGAPCEPVVLVQTVRLSFEHTVTAADGTVTTTVERLPRKSSIYEGVPIDPTDEEDAALQDAKTGDEQALDPNAIDDGTFVDSNWCEADAGINGEDEVDHGEKGTRTTPTSTDDSPYMGDAFFTGTRTKFIAEFEVCAYCMNPDRTLGQALGCMRWRYEREKGGSGRVSIPTPPGASGLPSESHTAAVARFETRHPVQRPGGGDAIKVCPERGVPEIQAEIRRLNEALKMAEAAGMDDLAEEIRAGIRERLEEIRRLRGRR